MRDARSRRREGTRRRVRGPSGAWSPRRGPSDELTMPMCMSWTAGTRAAIGRARRGQAAERRGPDRPSWRRRRRRSSDVTSRVDEIGDRLLEVRLLVAHRRRVIDLEEEVDLVDRRLVVVGHVVGLGGRVRRRDRSIHAPCDTRDAQERRTQSNLPQHGQSSGDEAHLGGAASRRETRQLGWPFSGRAPRTRCASGSHGSMAGRSRVRRSGLANSRPPLASEGGAAISLGCSPSSLARRGPGGGVSF